MNAEESSIVSFTGTVEAVEKELIPRLYLGRIRSNDNEFIVEMDMHSDLVVYKPGTQVVVELSRTKPQYREGIDFVAKGTLVSIKRENDYISYLISIGGLLFILKSRKELNISPTEKIYIKVAEQEA